jgi:hypothetical protein
MYYSDERVDEQMEYVDTILSKEASQVQTFSNGTIVSSPDVSSPVIHVNCSPYICTQRIFKHLLESLECIDDFAFRASGGLQSRL